MTQAGLRMAIPEVSREYPASLFRPDVITVPVVTRERLMSRIAGPTARKVTFIAAPAGSGKTVLLTQAHETFIQQGRRCLWLSFNGSDCDANLLQLLWVAADYAALPAAGHHAVTVNGFLRRIEACEEPVCIVIDCFEHVSKHADATLRQMIHGTSFGTAFLIAARSSLHLPVVPLEASGLLRKIGVADLALDEADIAALGQFAALPRWISVLNARVEGWPAMAQLALTRFREDPGLTAPVLSGCQHDIASFLERDVLQDLQTPELQLLMDASIVDRICGSLLDALSGGTDGAAVLSKLLARGVPMRETQYGWFRLHPLLREYLFDRARQQDFDRLTSLHQRAANVLLTLGDDQAALRHATATGNIDFLRTIYGQLSVSQALSGDSDDKLMEAGHTVASSDQTADPKWRALFDLIQSGQLDKARKSIAETRQLMPESVAANLADMRTMEWEFTYSDLLMRVYDDRLPRPEQLEVLRDRLMRTLGVPPSIPAAVSELIIVSRFRLGDLSGVAEADHSLWHTSALAPMQSKIYVLLELGIAALELGDMDLATRHLRHAKALATQAFGPCASQAHAASTLLAEVSFERGDPEAGIGILEHSFRKLKPEEVWFNLAASALTTASGEAAHRSWGDARHALELPTSLATHIGLWRLPPLVIALRLRLACLWSDDLEEARNDREALSSLGVLDLGELDGAGFGWRVSIPAHLAVIRFDLADRKPEAALARSLSLRPILEARRHVRRLIELNLLQGRASIEMRDHAAGYALIRAALKLSVDSGMLQSFLDEARFLGTVVWELLVANDISIEERAFLDRLSVKLVKPSARAARYVANGKTFDLSSREDQLLRALVTGKTFKEISFALNISVNTTKMHRTRLYRKLGCNSRSHAIALAQQFVAN